MEYDKFSQGSVSSLGGATPIILPYRPNWISIINSSRVAASSGVSEAKWQATMGEGAALVSTVGVGGALSQSYITSATGTGFTSFYAGLSLQFGAVTNVATVSKANPAVVTTSTAHGLTTGQVVIFQSLAQTSTTGMQQLASIPFVVTVTSTTSFTIPYDTTSTNFTAYNSGTATSQATVKRVLYPYLYFPGVNFISGITLGSTTTVTTTTPHNYVVGQSVAFRIPTVWGTTQLNPYPNPVIPGNPLEGFVISVPSSTSFVVDINSVGFTAYTVPVFANGLTFPQVVAVGDNNTGSALFGFDSLTINGPAGSGAFLNNTSQGFVIGPGVAGTSGDTIHWLAGFSVQPLRSYANVVV
jgi:hypothetical protein